MEINRAIVEKRDLSPAVWSTADESHGMRWALRKIAYSNPVVQLSMSRNVQLNLSLFGPAAATAALAGIVMSLLTSAANNIFVGVLLPIGNVVVLTLIAGAGIWLAIGWFVLHWWENGKRLPCRCCGGPLGWEVVGRFGPYRRCWACWQRVSQRHYT